MLAFALSTPSEASGPDHGSAGAEELVMSVEVNPVIRRARSASKAHRSFRRTSTPPILPAPKLIQSEPG